MRVCRVAIRQCRRGAAIADAPRTPAKCRTGLQQAAQIYYMLLASRMRWQKSRRQARGVLLGRRPLRWQDAVIAAADSAPGELPPSLQRATQDMQVLLVGVCETWLTPARGCLKSPADSACKATPSPPPPMRLPKRASALQATSQAK